MNLRSMITIFLLGLLSGVIIMHVLMSKSSTRRDNSRQVKIDSLNRRVDSLLLELDRGPSKEQEKEIINKLKNIEYDSTLYEYVTPITE